MSNFKPTHRHIKTGNLYQKLVSIKIQFRDVWYDAIKYKNSIGDEFARPVYAFNLKFEELPEFNYPWDQAPDEAMFAATDADGSRYWYKEYPVKDNSFENDGYFYPVTPTSFHECIDVIEDCENWENSVQARPA